MADGNEKKVLKKYSSDHNRAPKITLSPQSEVRRAGLTWKLIEIKEIYRLYVQYCVV